MRCDEKIKYIINKVENLYIWFWTELFFYIYSWKYFLEQEKYNDALYCYILAFKEENNIDILKNIIICLEKLNKIDELEKIIENEKYITLEIYDYIWDYFFEKEDYHKSLKFYELSFNDESYEKIIECYDMIWDIEKSVKIIKWKINEEKLFFEEEWLKTYNVTDIKYRKVWKIFYKKWYYKEALDFFSLSWKKKFILSKEEKIFIFSYLKLKNIEDLKKSIKSYNISKYRLEEILDELFIEKSYEEALLLFGILYNEETVRFDLEKIFKILFILKELWREKEIFNFLKLVNLDEYDFQELFEVVSNFFNDDTLAFNLIKFKNNPNIIFDDTRLLSTNENIIENIEKPKELYRISRFSNLESIIDLWILSRKLADKYINYKNNSYLNIQDRREYVWKYNLHDYAPLFFSLYPAMIYSNQIRENINDQIIIIFDWELIKQRWVLFSDISLAYKDKSEENIFDDISKIKNLDFSIFERKGWEDDIEIRKKKWAEVLIRDKIDFWFAKSIICFDFFLKQKIEKILEEKWYNLEVVYKDYIAYFF